MIRSIEISSGFYIYLAVLLLFLPLPWIAAVLSASLLHEAGHLLAISIMNIPIHRISINAAGARIMTVPMTQKQELLAACAGPAVGIALIFTFPIFPRLSLLAAAQTLFNLLPVIPFDGGRIYRILSRMLFGERHFILACRAAEILSYTVLAALAIFLAQFSFWMSAAALFILLRLIPQKTLSA